MRAAINKLFAYAEHDSERGLDIARQILYHLLKYLFGFSLLVLLGSFFIFVRKEATLLLSLIFMTIILISQRLLSKGRIAGASLFFLTSLWLVFTTLIWFSGGMYSIATILYVVLAIEAGILIGRKGAILFTVISCIMPIVFYFLDTAGLQAPRYFPYPRNTIIVLWFGVFGITLPIINLATRTLRDSLQKSNNEIEERKKVEAELYEKTNELYHQNLLIQNITEHIPDIIYIYDLKTNSNTYINKDLPLLLGYNSGELPEDSLAVIEKLLHPDDRKQFENYSAKVRTWKTDYVLDFEYRLAAKDGSWHWFSGKEKVFRKDGDRILSLIGTVREITERRETEKQLLIYKQAMANSPDAMFLFNKAAQIITTNNSASEMLGYSADEFKSMNLDRISNNFSLERWIERWDALKENTKQNFESVYRNKNNHLIPVEISVAYIEHGGNEYNLALARDISERKLAEEAMRESEEKFSKAFNSSNVAISITNIEYGKYLLVNEGFTRITGYSANEAAGKTSLDLNLWECPTDQKKMIEQLRNFGHFSNMELNVRRKDGTLITGIFSADFISIRGIKHILSTFQDITARKEMEKDMLMAKEKAEEMSRLKSSFLANMSHELRTPMIGILGYSEFLEAKTSEGEVKRIAGIINFSGRRLMETLNLILDLSRIESGKYEIKLINIEIISFIHEIRDSFLPAADAKQLYLDVQTELDECFLNLDETMFRSILNNLVNNSIKFTQSGGIRIMIKLSGTYQTPGVEIHVIDTGVGIEPEKHDMIFEEFRQASEGIGRTFEGTGLGLSITKKYIEILHGEISLSSSIGHGSTFVIRFPLPPQPTLSEQFFQVPHSQSIPVINYTKYVPSILFVEDDPIAFSLVNEMLKDKFTIHNATDSSAALKMVSAKKYDIIFMDINLGRGPDGLQTAKQIKQLKEYTGVPIVAITAYAMLGDKEEFLKNGCTHYLAKPFAKVELFDLINEILPA